MKHSTWVSLILLAALGVAVVQWLGLRKLRLALELSRAEMHVLQQRVQEAEVERSQAGEARLRARQERDAVLARTVTVEAELAKEDPEHYWVEPPVTWPEWVPESPYVWLRKEDLSKLHPPVFTQEGRLRPEVAGVMVMDESAIQTVNDTLPRLLQKMREIEASRAVLLDEPLLGIVEDGPTMTVQVPPQPEEAGLLRNEFERVLREQIGDQRADLLLESASGWLGQQFNTTEDQSKTYSLVRHPNGSINISIKSPSTTMSVGGNLDQINVGRYIPEHLLYLFEPVLSSAPIEQAQQTAQPNP